MRRAQSIVLRTSRTPLRYLWAAAYALLARALGWWLKGLDRRVTVYAARGLGTGGLVYGASDIDLVVVAPGDERRPRTARERVLLRYERLRRLLPRLCRTIFDDPVVLERDDLVQAAAGPTHVYGLAADPGTRTAPAVYFGAHVRRHRIRLQERPGLLGPTADWRRLSGPGLPLLPPRRDQGLLRLAAWLELQAWWRFLLQACARPPTPDLPLLCVKLVSEPARIWLALVHGEYPSSRREVLRRALRLLPEEQAAVGRAIWLEAALPSRPEPPVAEFLPYLVRFSHQIAVVLAGQVAGAGTTSVRLDWDREEELALGKAGLSALEDLCEGQGRLRPIPLVDWRALTRATTPWPAGTVSEPPDESLAPVKLDPSELPDLVSAVEAGNSGPYPALRAGDVLVLASQRWPRTQLRAVQCPLTDPVSFALLADRTNASYPNASGWSAGDSAARAVFEHRAWLEHPNVFSAGGEALGMLISAARAALFYESIADGNPELPLTVASTLGRMRALNPKLTSTLDEVEASYVGWRTGATTPGESLLRAAREAVGGMRAYACVR